MMPLLWSVQPLMARRARTPLSRSSVVLLPNERIARIFSLRAALRMFFNLAISS